MEYRKLGNSGLEVSKLCLGTMMFGARTNEATAKKIVDQARDAGVNFIDTADVYAKGKSERITGKLIKKHRDHWILATKVGNNMGPGKNGLGADWIKRGCDDSLRRLKTDYIDVYYMHKDDMSADMEETLTTMAELIKAGKIRHWAVSNFRAWRIAEMVGICDRLKLPRPVAGQPYYNAMNRMPEVEYLPCCEAFDIAVVPYSPLSRGILTGKYDPKAAPKKGTRAGDSDKRMLSTEWRKESLVIAQKIKKYAEKRGIQPGHLAVQWVLNNSLVSSVIAGPRTLGQWKDYVSALKYEFTAEDEALIDKLVAPGHPSTPGYTDPMYPVIGRQPLVGDASGD
ncbi:MAG: aldo/keto reductase [Alphaproteobacteria bacterium]